MHRLFAHRQPDEELRKSEARYRTVLDAAFDAIVTITPDGIVRWFNRGAERIFGYRAEEIIGRPVTVLMPKRYRDLCMAGLRRYLRTGEARVVGGTTDLVGLRKGGSEFPIEMSLGEILEDGEQLFTSVIRDVTERKRTEDALREARDRFRSIFDHAPIGVAMVSLQGQYMQVNRSLCEILGYNQPIVALENDKIAGVEALVRWDHPQRGLLLPEEFLSVAEETGLIVRIGQWVLREAGKQARIWKERYPGTPPLTISVNLSTKEFFHPKLVAEVLDESDIELASLQLEITEGAMMTSGTYSADRTLRNLKRMGVQLAIDDFGLGYSSLSYLKRFPVDLLKIDRSFIAGLELESTGVSTKDTEIVKAMIELTHALGLGVIAEGVETSEQLARLRNMKCDFAQGNYFSKPLPSEELAGILAENLTDRG
jgi:PAS domain S-box-containing protein